MKFQNTVALMLFGNVMDWLDTVGFSLQRQTIVASGRKFDPDLWRTQQTEEFLKELDHRCEMLFAVMGRMNTGDPAKAAALVDKYQGAGIPSREEIIAMPPLAACYILGLFLIVYMQVPALEGEAFAPVAEIIRRVHESRKPAP